MKVVQVNAGQLKPLLVEGDTIQTGFYKSSQSGPVRVIKMGLESDTRVACASDPNRAVLFYRTNNYDYWRKELNRDIPCGMFGENITYDGWGEESFCIGDELQIGSVRLKITQPRHPCVKMGAKMGDPGFPAKFVKSLRLGFHCSVRQEGELQEGDEIKLVYRAKDPLTLHDFSIPVHLNPKDIAGLEKVLACSELVPEWRIRAERLWRRMSGRVEGWSEYRPLKIENLRQECDDVVAFDLQNPTGDKLPEFDAGQFLTMQFAIPGEERPAVRTYTIAGRSADGNGYSFAVKRLRNSDGTSGLVSSHILEKACTDDLVNALPPRGHFIVEPGSRPVVLLSAGIGVTPTLSMFEQLKSCPLGRDVYFVHGARQGDQHILAEKVCSIAADWPKARRFIKYSQPNSDDLRAGKADGIGHITVDDLESLIPTLDADYYICGPVRFMQDIIRGLVARGVSKDQINYEFFGAGIPLFEEEAVVQPGSPVMDQNGKPVVVTFAKSGVSVPWTDNVPSILVLAERNGIRPPHSCRNGLCEVCICHLDSGEVAYEGEILTPPEEGEVMICCAKPVTSVMVDA